MKNNQYYVWLGLIVALFYIHTIPYPFRVYDEDLIYNETIFPIPQNISELFLYIKEFGLNAYFEASSSFYSHIANLRCNPVNTFLTMFVEMIFKKSSHYYHLFSLVLHIASTVLLFKILNNITFFSTHRNINFLLALLWALHPLQIESVVFATNWLALVTYLLAFYIFYLTCFTQQTTLKKILLFVLTLFAFFTCEHVVFLPFVILSYLMVAGKPLLNAVPVLGSFVVYFIYFICNTTASNLTSGYHLERIFWFAPQVFIHNILLLLVPWHLTLDQSSLVKVSSQFLHAYPLFCTLVCITLVVCLFVFKNVRLLLLPALIAFLPFTHILSPLYNITSERYFYFPTFFLVIGLCHLFERAKSKERLLVIFSLLVTVLFVYSVRTYARTYDWRNNQYLFSSAVNEAPNNLYRGLRFATLAGLCGLEIKPGPECAAYVYNANQSLDIVLNAEIRKQPNIIKYYGLDDMVMKARAAYVKAYLLTSIKPPDNFAILTPYIDYVRDSQMLDYYLVYLTYHNDLDRIEELCKNLYKTKISSPVLKGLSFVEEKKYKNYKKAEEYLLQAHKLFPYNATVMQELVRLYETIGDKEKRDKFNYKYEIRTHKYGAIHRR